MICRPQRAITNFRLFLSDAARRLFCQTYKNSPKDLANIETEFGPPDFGERLRVFVHNSMHSIIHDFRFIGEEYWDTAAKIGTPIHFIHGTGDGVSPASEIPKLIDRLGRGELTLIDGAGNMPSYSHLPQFMEAIVAILNEDPE